MNKWREAIIIPILKSNHSKIEPKSYRPISLTCTMCKVIEKIINRRLWFNLERSNLINRFQSGFRKHRSTTDNLVQLHTEALDAFANKQELIAVFFDMNKAFDTTWRHRVLRKLKQWKIDGNILYFNKNFLDERTFRVRLGNTYSDQYLQQNGLPQGSVLSPTLFLIAIEDVVDFIKTPIKPSIFADNLLIMCRGHNSDTSTKLIQSCIDKLVDWSKTSGFIFSQTKTEVMKFSRRRFKICNLKLRNKPIPTVKHHTFLGVIFDTRLTWHEHIRQLKSDCMRRLI